MSNVIPFTNSFDATHMAMRDIPRKVRELGWASFRTRAEEFAVTGRLIVYRVSRKKAS